MKFVISLIAAPNGPVIDDQLIRKLADAAAAYVDSFADPVELSPGRAYDIYLREHPRPDLIAAYDRIAIEARVDLNILPQDDRRKSLLVADMDSTIIGQECIDELAEFAGKRAEISAITDRAMRGELDFEDALRARVAMLKGLPDSVLQETFDKKITLNPGAKTLIATMKAQGAKAVLVSGGFSFFTARVAAAAGFDAHQANELLVENGALTGRVREPILGREAKQAALERFTKEFGLTRAQTMAVGDGANDLSMLARSGLGVAFHAKPAVAEAAEARIHRGDLTALLYLQGIAQSEFVETL